MTESISGLSTEENAAAVVEKLFAAINNKNTVKTTGIFSCWLKQRIKYLPLLNIDIKGLSGLMKHLESLSILPKEEIIRV
ncbi:MAG: hypothetical protein PHQ65_15520 [Bacteroidales bacterium]|nr:hypothetical protein [Bacteroidales bacterium]